MSLQTSIVHRSLDKKLTLLGYDLAEILGIFIVLAVLNLLFGRSTYALFLTWLPTLCLALFLRMGRTNRPENYLLHWIRYYFSPGVYSAFKDPAEIEYPFKRSLI